LLKCKHGFNEIQPVKEKGERERERERKIARRTKKEREE
jgi:hypothetical protein